jgi:hypothetical protein
MRTRAIPADQWSSFLNRFTADHEGAMVSMEIFGPELGLKTEVKRSRLRGVSGGASQDDAIDIFVENDADGHLDHRVNHPVRLYVALTEGELQDSLEIVGGDGTHTLLRLHSP